VPADEATALIGELEEKLRSTATILAAANALIAHNSRHRQGAAAHPRRSAN